MIEAPQNFEKQCLVFPRYHLPGGEQHPLVGRNSEFLPEPPTLRTAALYRLDVDADARQEIGVPRGELFPRAHIVLAVN